MLIGTRLAKSIFLPPIWTRNRRQVRNLARFPQWPARRRIMTHGAKTLPIGYIGRGDWNCWKARISMWLPIQEKVNEIFEYAYNSWPANSETLRSKSLDKSLHRRLLNSKRESVGQNSRFRRSPNRRQARNFKPQFPLAPLCCLLSWAGSRSV